MKKTLCILCVSLCLCTLLFGCGAAKECQHQWAEADCLTPSRCTLCAVEQGEALGHDWQEPSCESPQRCSRCGAEQGQATGHIWLDASCESPERCGSCGETRGDKAEHRYGDWMLGSEEMYRLCSQCQHRDAQEIDYALFVNETLPGHWNACYRIRNGSVQRLFHTTPPAPDPEIIFRPDGSILTGGGEWTDTGEVWAFDRAEFDPATGQHNLYIRTGAAGEGCLSCMDESILYTATDSKGETLIMAKAQGNTLAPLLSGEWAAFSVDRVYTITLTEDRRFTADFDGDVSGYWQARPLESSGGSFYSAELLLNYVKDGEEKTVYATLSSINLQVSEQLRKKSLSLMVDLRDDWLAFGLDAGEKLREMADQAATAPLGVWNSTEYVISYPGKLVDGEYVQGEEERGLSTEHSITFSEDGTFTATLYDTFEGTWSLRSIKADDYSVHWDYHISAPGLKDASYFSVSSEGRGYLYIHTGEESANYNFRQMSQEEVSARNQRIESAPTKVVGRWYDANRSGAEFTLNEDGTFLLTNGDKSFEGLWHFGTMSEGGADTYYYFYDLETEQETFLRTLLGEDYDIASLLEEAPKDEETGEVEKYREERAITLTDMGGSCTLELNSYMGVLQMLDSTGMAAAEEATSLLVGRWSADTAWIYDKAAEESIVVPGDYSLTIAPDGSFTGHIGQDVQGTWSYMNPENGAELFLLTFEGFELSCRFVLEDNTLTGPCSPYIVELHKDS